MRIRNKTLLAVLLSLLALNLFAAVPAYKFTVDTQDPQREWEINQLQVARGLASNTRAVVQVGGNGTSPNELARAFTVRTMAQEADARTNENVETSDEVDIDSALP